MYFVSTKSVAQPRISVRCTRIAELNTSSIVSMNIAYKILGKKYRYGENLFEHMGKVQLNDFQIIY